jgi:superfamily II DNA/RNA helicase
MLDRGFAPDVERILAHTPRERQTALFSATVPEWVAQTADKHLRRPITVEVDHGKENDPATTHVAFDLPDDDKLSALRDLLDLRGAGSIIVFGRTKHGVKKLAQRLVERGYPSAALQGNLSQNARERVMSDFRAGRVPILLATNVAARGLDVQDVGVVINYELPESAEWFTHRVGRTGRMGKAGQAITFLTSEDSDKWRQIERALGRKLHRSAWDARGDVAVVAGSAPVQDGEARQLARPSAPAGARPRRRGTRQPWVQADRRPRPAGAPTYGRRRAVA